MEHSEQIKQFAAAFVAAQKEIKGAPKTSVNPHFRSSYADLGSVMDACKEALNAHGISVIQTPAPSDTANTLALDTVLMHQSGEWVSGRTVIPLGKSDPQGYGSAMTYARRYSLAAMVGVCPEDDDGEGAMGRGQQQNGKTQPPRQQAKPEPKATADMIHTIKDLQQNVHLPEGTVERWFAAAGVERWEDMAASKAQKCIDAMLKKLPAGAAA